MEWDSGFHCVARSVDHSSVVKDLDCVFPIWITQRVRVWFSHRMLCPCHVPAVLRPFRFASDFSRPRRNTAWNLWINIGCLSTACGRSAHVRFLPAATRSFMIGSSDFSGYARTFTKDTAVSENDRGTARYVWISKARHGSGTAWYVWISL